MASTGSSSLLARTRSTRSTTNATKPPGRGLVAAASTAAPPAPTPIPASQSGGSLPSNLDLFLANLRILDLDLLPDWPGISAQTFAGNAASQGQKKRVHCVEWALYQLFVLWDQEEARKLQAYFPPSDQVQSLNLRAALLRCLEQAKKNGVLGRDTVIRKTMLDECKGERLEEVLAAFSFAVVRRVVGDDAEASGQHPALAQTLALENRGYTGERTELAALKLAHQASLSRTLRKKKETRALFDDFADLLDVKDRSIVRRREQIKSIDAQNSTQTVTDDEKLDVWRLVRNNWAGNERWMETLLYGDANARRDGLLTTPFDKVWRRVQSGRVSELEDHGTGLLEQLEGRSKLQRERLEKWDGFRKRMLGEGNMKKRVVTNDAPEDARKGLGLRFDAHHHLHPDRMSTRKNRSIKPAPLSAEYSDLIAAFEDDMKQAGKPVAKPITELLPRREVDRTRLSAEAPTEEAISELSELEEEIKPPEAKETGEKVSQLKTKHRSLLDRKELDDELSHRQTSVPKPAKEEEKKRHARQPSKSLSKDKRRSPPISPTRHSRPDVNRSPTRDLIARQSIQVKSPDLEEPPVSPTQAEADEILASMNTASPSPAKQPKQRHTLSLAERTRLTMGRKSSKNLSSEDEEECIPLRLSAAKTTPPIPQEDDTATDGYEDLVARTRKSMAGFEAARQKAQLERRKSQRKSKMMARREGSSYFPKVDEGTEDTSILAEELMEGESNYEDVFMSRPRIKTSPAASPTKEWEDDE